FVHAHVDPADAADGIDHQQRPGVAQQGADLCEVGNHAGRTLVWTTTTARYAFTFSRSAISTASGASPQGTCSRSSCTGKPSAIDEKRSPNCPFSITSTASPVVSTLTSAASIPPVPEPP